MWCSSRVQYQLALNLFEIVFMAFGMVYIKKIGPRTDLFKKK